MKTTPTPRNLPVDEPGDHEPPVKEPPRRTPPIDEPPPEDEPSDKPPVGDPPPRQPPAKTARQRTCALGFKSSHAARRRSGSAIARRYRALPRTARRRATHR